MSHRINLSKEIRVFILKKCKFSLFVLIILPFIIAVFNSYFFPKNFSLLIKFMLNSDRDNIIKIVKLIIIATIGLQLFRFLQNKMLYNFLVKLNDLIKKKSMEYFLSLSMEVDVVTYGEKVNTLSQQICDFLQISFSIVYKSLVSVLVTLTVLLINNHFLMKIFIIFFTIFSFTLYKSIRSIMSTSKELEKQLVHNKLYVSDIARNFFFEKLFHLQKITMKIFNHNMEKETAKISNKYECLTNKTLLCNGLVAITSCTMMLLNAISGKEPTLKVMTFQVINRFFMEMNDIVNIIIPLLNNMGAMEEQYEFFKKPIKNTLLIEESVSNANHPVYSVTLKNISYAYNNKQVLENFSYEFKSPGLYVIHGDSGKGKSTLAQIIAGVRKPTFGQIIYNHSNESVVGSVSYMTQSDGIYNRTVRENIFINGESNIKKNLIEEMGIDNILDKTTGINGQYLSGGQVRRINFLRMINSYKPGNLMIFDEPFIELDNHLMDKIKTNILFYSLHNIVIVIDHTHTLQSTDEVKIINIYL